MSLGMKGVVGAILSLAVVPSVVSADTCDYKPSTWMGSAGATGTAAAGATASATGAGMQAAGFYSIVNATTSSFMLGSTAAGASGAGTVGIIGGTSGIIGGAGAVVMSPFVIIGGAVLAAGTGGYEAICLLDVERITDYDQVLWLVEEWASHFDPSVVALGSTSDGRRGLVVTLNGDRNSYLIEDLYIADGVLMHRDWLDNTVISREFSFRISQQGQ